VKITVPWNASWTGENDYEVRPCRWVGHALALWQPHKPGVGRPLFAKPHNVRQRQSVARFLCTVCGKPTDKTDRWWFKLGSVTDGYFMTTEAPTHRACSDYALTVCPHLKGRDADLERFPKGAVVLKSMIGGPATDNDFGVRIAGRRVVGHLKFGWPVKVYA
jgi:hypothetical protein